MALKVQQVYLQFASVNSPSDAQPQLNRDGASNDVASRSDLRLHFGASPTLVDHCRKMRFDTKMAWHAKGKFEGSVTNFRSPRQWALRAGPSATASEPWGSHKFHPKLRLQYSLRRAKKFQPAIGQQSAKRKLLDSWPLTEPHVNLPQSGLSVARVRGLTASIHFFPCVSAGAALDSVDVLSAAHEANQNVQERPISSPLSPGLINCSSRSELLKSALRDS